ncbi:hypothetical protein [Streptomyces xylophagus]|uniref:hypothetical protein n=1 Tax=Streptomyces xylophagus TaxID=285514 RepID=UPI0018FE53EE|nr:hypothetical protein [Streptomyces xylophagus]
MSAECAVAQQPGYADLHDECQQTKDIPLPGGSGILLKVNLLDPSAAADSP